MNIKRILTLALCVIYMFSAAVFAAAEEIAPEANTLTITVVDGVAGRVKISGIAPSGEAGQIVTLLVTNVDVANDENNDIEDIEASIATRLQYQNTIVTGAEGRFEQEFMLNINETFADVDGSVSFDFYAGGEAYAGSEVATGYLWYAPIDVKLAAAKAVVEEADMAASGATIADNKAVFAVESELFEALDKTKLATLLDAKTQDVAFLELTDANLEANIAEYEKFDTTLRLSIALEAYNQSKKDIVITEIGFANDDIIGLADYIAANGNLDELYTSDIKAAAIENVTNALFGQNVAEAADLHKIFAKEIIVQALKNNKKSGSGIIEEILTEENLAAAGYDVVSEGNNTLKSEYFENSDLEDVNNDIYQNRKNIKAENLEAKILESAKKNYEPEDAGNSGITGPTDSSDRGSVSVGIGGSSKPVQPDPAPVDPQPTKKSFNDLTGYDWAKVAIETLAEKGIINGVADDKFAPEGTLTREAAAKIICLAAGIEPAAEGVAFADVDANAWYAPYIAALNKAGIINGVSDTAFGIGNNVTREDFAVMICRALNYTATNSSSFTDAADISAYAADAVNALFEKGIVGGYEDGSFKPKANISRAEGAKIIFGILSK